MKIGLHYGEGLLYLQIPEANIQEIICPWQDDKSSDNASRLREALTGRQTEDFQRASAGKRLCVLLDDGTRDEPFDDIFAQLCGLLSKSSIVRFLICTGTHNPDTIQNRKIVEQIEDAARSTGLRHFQIRAHD